MTQPEFLSWLEFYKLHPFDDFHRYHRPAAWVARSMSGIDPDDSLQWLQPQAVQDGLSAADLRTLKAFGIKPPPPKE